MAEIHTQTPSPILSPTATTVIQHHPAAATAAKPGTGFNLMVLLAAILCAFLCALGLNTMLQCVFQCANRVLTEPLRWIATRRLNSGLKKKEMVALPTSTYSHNNSGGSPSSSSSSSNCAICLADFSDGDKIRFLPKCNHRFHVACIDKWLLSHSSCPTCRHLLKSNNESLTHSFPISMPQP